MEEDVGMALDQPGQQRRPRQIHGGRAGGRLDVRGRPGGRDPRPGHEHRPAFSGLSSGGVEHAIGAKQG
jgi:hypothetical protein